MPNKMIRKIFTTQIKEVEGTPRTLEFTITAETEDRDGEVVKASGGVFDNYVKNPVVLWVHDYKGLPVGKTIAMAREGPSIKAVVEFPTKEEYEYADTVYKLCKGGYLGAVSIGFIPLESVKGKSDSEPSRTFTKWELLEFSIVPVPSNPDTLVMARESGLISVKEFNALLEKGASYNEQLNRNQLQDACWQMMDTFAQCVITTCNDSEDNDKPKTLKAHCKSFNTNFLTWVDNAASAGLFAPEQVGSDLMMLSFKEYFTRKPQEAKKPSQESLKDEIDYLTSMISQTGLSDETSTDPLLKAIGEALKMNVKLERIAGSDIPVQIEEPPQADKKNLFADYLSETIRRQINGG
jgi:HK97 family phage prohead protease